MKPSPLEKIFKSFNNLFHRIQFSAVDKNRPVEYLKRLKTNYISKGGASGRWMSEEIEFRANLYSQTRHMFEKALCRVELFLAFFNCFLEKWLSEANFQARSEANCKNYINISSLRDFSFATLSNF